MNDNTPRSNRNREAEALIRRAEYAEFCAAQLRYGAAVLNLASALEAFGVALYNAVRVDAEVVGD